MCEGTTTSTDNCSEEYCLCFFNEYFDECVESGSNADYVRPLEFYLNFKWCYEQTFGRDNGVPTRQAFTAWMTRKLGAPNPHWRGIKLS